MFAMIRFLIKILFISIFFINISYAEIIKEINKSKVDILFVALGAPKQEIWMYDNYKNGGLLILKIFIIISQK